MVSTHPPPPTGVYTPANERRSRELFLWAATVFSSRSFSGKLMAWTDDLTTAAMAEPDSLPALFPLMDAVNHQPRTKTTWQPGAGMLSAVSGAAIAAGAEVCNNYGPKSNEERTCVYIHSYI